MFLSEKIDRFAILVANGLLTVNTHGSIQLSRILVRYSRYFRLMIAETNYQILNECDFDIELSKTPNLQVGLEIRI